MSLGRDFLLGWERSKLTVATAQVDDTRVSTTDEISKGDSILLGLDCCINLIGASQSGQSWAGKIHDLEPIVARRGLMMVRYWVCLLLKHRGSRCQAISLQGT